MAEFVKLKLRGDHCPAAAEVASMTGTESGILLCNLERGHPGPLHYDSVDKVWWAPEGRTSD